MDIICLRCKINVCSSGKLCDSCKASNRAYYQKHKDELKRRAKEYQQENLEKFQEWNKKYYSTHKEVAAKRCADYRKNHPEVGRIASRKRRALKLELNEVYTNEDELYTRALFNNACANCGCTETLAIDHHLPLTKGHVLTRKNAVVLCKACNSSKSDQLPAEFYSEEKLKEIEFLLAI